MGQKIVLTESFTDSTLPILYNDSLLSSGSLMLMDFGHSLGGFSGVPANGSLIPNIAWNQANALVAGAPGQSALSMVMNASAAASPNFPLIERTPKLGLHAIKSQANDTGGSFYLSMPAAIATYMSTNSAHSYYFSIWDYVTRQATTYGSPYPGVALFGTNTVNMMESLAVASGNPWYPNNGSGKSLGSTYTRNYYSNTGANFAAAAWSGVTGTLGSFVAIPYVFGGTGGPFNGLHVGASQLLYRIYLEDLTVSGRTYATVEAADLALYNTAFGSGGKFYGDTFTSPSGYP